MLDSFLLLMINAYVSSFVLIVVPATKVKNVLVICLMQLCKSLWQTDWDLRLASLLLFAFDCEGNFWQLYGDFLPSADECTSLLLASEVCIKQTGFTSPLLDWGIPFF